MTSYKEIIQAQCRQMPRSINWWPHYLYHYTDVNHAASIIDSGWIYDRATASHKHLIKTDAASQNVLQITGDKVKRCGRLYMRPLTPTQFYSEGYKPEAVRHEDYKDANCPVPAFFLLDAVKTLEYPGVFFVECGAAGYHTEEWKTGAEEYAALCLEKIFHQGSTGHDPSILKYRRTEVLREGGIPLRGLLKRVVCRSSAEKQTLLSLILKRCPAQYNEYSRLVMAAPAYIRMNLFNYYNCGMYVQRVKAQKHQVILELNESSLRYNYYARFGETQNSGVPVEMAAHLLWRDSKGQIIDAEDFYGVVDYTFHNAVILNYGRKVSDYFTLEFELEKNLMFQSDFYIGNQDVVY